MKMKRNWISFALTFALSFAVQAVDDGVGVVFEELDITIDVDFWNTQGHVNPVCSSAAASLAGTDILVASDAESGNYLSGNAFDTRHSYEPVSSSPVAFTSEPASLRLIVR